MAQPAASDAGRRSLIFRLGGDQFEMDATNVVEVIRMPPITRVPYAPVALVGITNLRGQVLPVVSFGTLLNLPMASEASERKIVVYDRGEPIGLLVDDVIRLGDAAGTERKIDLDRDGRLDELFKVTRMQASRARQAAPVAASEALKAIEATNALLSFRVGSQLFAIRLENVHEILSASSERSPVVSSSDAITGITDFRGSVLPIISLAALLGLKAAEDQSGGRIVVIDYRGSTIGLAVDRIDSIRRLPESSIDPVPAILRHGGGPAEIDAIGRADNGRTLLSILSVERLFGHGVIERAVRDGDGASLMAKSDAAVIQSEKILVFLLGDEYYGVPIASIDEVVQVPETVTRLPHAPAFVIGAINLRGKAVPLIDQRQRFAAVGSAAVKARAVIITANGMQAGFIVDAVSEVMTVPLSAFSPAPEFSSDETAVFDRVVHVEADDRIILIVDPKQLLSRAETDVIASLSSPKATAMPS